VCVQHKCRLLPPTASRSLVGLVHQGYWGVVTAIEVSYQHVFGAQCHKIRVSACLLTPPPPPAPRAHAGCLASSLPWRCFCSQAFGAQRCKSLRLRVHPPPHTHLLPLAPATLLTQDAWLCHSHGNVLWPGIWCAALQDGRAGAAARAHHQLHVLLRCAVDVAV
jgi:hypothetical protein